MTQEDGELRIRAKEPTKRKLDVDKFWGKAQGMLHGAGAARRFRASAKFAEGQALTRYLYIRSSP